MPLENIRERLEDLTERELEVLRMVCLGLEYKVIASELVITEATVKSHAQHIYIKLGIEEMIDSQRKKLLFSEICPALKEKEIRSSLSDNGGEKEDKSESSEEDESSKEEEPVIDVEAKDVEDTPEEKPSLPSFLRLKWMSFIIWVVCRF